MQKQLLLGLTSFDSDGFTLGKLQKQINGSSTYVLGTG
jgi:hypothetical protein